MTQTTVEINLGAIVCKKIKSIYFADKEWVDCHRLVAQKFSEFKKKMRAFYTDKTEIELLDEIRKYSDDDIRDALD